MTAGFDITEGKGFHIRFENGWTISVQIGAGNYCTNRNNFLYGQYVGPSYTAEVAVFAQDQSGKDVWEKNSPYGWQTSEQVAKHIARVSRKRAL